MRRWSQITVMAIAVSAGGCIDWAAADQGFCNIVDLEGRRLMCGLNDPHQLGDPTEVVAAATIGGEGEEALTAVAPAPGGGVWMGGVRPKAGGSGTEGFVVRATETAAEEPLTLSGTGSSRVMQLLAGTGGTLWALAEIDGQTSLFGRGTVEAAGSGALITRMDGTTLAPQASRVLQPSAGSTLVVSELAVRGDRVAVSGTLTGSMTVDGATVTLDGNAQAFVVVFDQALGYLWHVTSEQCAAIHPMGLALDVVGRVLFTADLSLGSETCVVAGIALNAEQMGWDRFSLLTRLLEPEAGGAAPVDQFRLFGVEAATNIVTPFAPNGLFATDDRVVWANQVREDATQISCLQDEDLFPGGGGFWDGVQQGPNNAPDNEDMVRARIAAVDETQLLLFGTGVGRELFLGLSAPIALLQGVHGFVRSVPRPCAMQRGSGRILESDDYQHPVRLNAATLDASGATWAVGGFQGSVTSSFTRLTSAGGEDGFYFVIRPVEEL